MIDLVRVYCALARFGKPVTLLLTTGEDFPSDLRKRFPFLRDSQNVAVELGEEKELNFSFTEEACFLVAEALTRAPKALRRPLGYAWKTGNSWGRHDSWTIAYTPRYTVGVWFGNFSGEPAEALVGAEAAAPCALEIISYLDPRAEWPEKPEGIEEGLLCIKTGLSAGKYCPHVVRGRVLKRDRRRCNVHIRFPLDKESGQILCRSCLIGRDFFWKVFEVWPKDVEAYLEANGKEPLPEHFSGCRLVCLRSAPEFVTPSEGGRYILRDGAIPVEVLSTSKEIFYFLDDRFLGRKPKGFSLKISPGKHKLSCIEAGGGRASVEFECFEEERVF